MTAPDRTKRLSANPTFRHCTPMAAARTMNVDGPDRVSLARIWSSTQGIPVFDDGIFGCSGI
jgi:hypothetical protein